MNEDKEISGKSSKDKFDKSESSLRSALLDVYNYKCFYTGMPVDFDDLNVDHIIPESLNNKKKDLKDYLSKVGLDEDFNLNSLYNLVPAKMRINRDKSDDLFEEDYAKYLLNRAKLNAEKVLEKYKNFKSKKITTKTLEAIRSGIHEKGVGNAEEYYNFLANENQPFPEIDRKVENNKYFKSKPTVSLEATLPMYPRLEGSCSLRFRSLKVRNCMVNLGHKEIVEVLFEGLGTPFELELRGFIDATIQHEEEKVFFIQLSNSTFPLNQTEVKDLCDIIDDFSGIYLNERRKLDNILGTNRFRKTEKNNYKLIQIKRETWQMLINFANRHDYEAGTTKWHMFEPNNLLLKIITHNTSRYEAGLHAMLQPEQVDSTLAGMLKPDDKIWITWGPMGLSNLLCKLI
ncbi:HNH endonuclease [Paenibacillus sp. 1_12]|uniref:HNH endonuclease n=1 Tax=Paenibacillus sp. 1_12 TaxID=1566278 RepID=UPI0008ED7FFD|nr:DUF1524 domain-containing protein [Paenibacillus sp. 1_12]SFM20946.1 HNH endonuclease [Paenibacillus sp. 1_12]